MPLGLSGLGRFSEPGLLILLSLAESDKHGYAMLLDIRESFGVNIGPATLYQALDRLEDRGLIEPLAAESRRRPYRITPRGKDELQGQLLQMRKLSIAGLERLSLS